MKAGQSKTKGPAPPAKPSFGTLYWFRLGCGVAGGVASFLAFPPTPTMDAASNGMLLAVIVYLATYYVARYLFYRKIGREYVTKLYSTGIGGYIMLFLFTWILLFTLLS